MKKLLKISIVGLVVGVLLVSGCISTETISAAQIKASALQSVSDVTSYSFSITGEIEIAMSNDTGTVMSYVISSSGNGTIDTANNNLMTDIELYLSILEQTMTIETTLYIIDNVVYAKIDENWTKSNVTDLSEQWQSNDQMEIQRFLLEVSDVEKLDDEIVDGVNCYVLKIEPDLELLYQVMMNQPGADFSDPLPHGNLSDYVTGFSIKQWIAKDTNLWKKIYAQMTVEYSQDLGYMFMDYFMDMNFEIVFSNYNAAVDIELPEEAENAPWSWL